MNPNSDQPRSTPVHSELLPSSRPAFNAGAFFAHKDRLTRLCSAVSLAALIVAGLALALALANSRQKVYFVVFDPAGNGHVGQGLEFHEAKDVQLQQAMLATAALFLRNPRDFDQPEILQALYSRSAQTQAAALKAAEAAEFSARQIRQKPEILSIEATATRQAEVQIQVTGQLLRFGLIKDGPFMEIVRFTLRLVLAPNPDLLRSGRIPLLVTQFSVKYEPPSP